MRQRTRRNVLFALVIAAIAVVGTVVWVLAAAGGGSLTGRAFAPAQGTTATSFTFQVDYHDDVAGDPGTRNIQLSRDGGTSWYPAAGAAMTKGAGSPTDPGGQRWTWTGTFASLAIPAGSTTGTATQWRLTFIDSEGGAVAGGASAAGPDVNNPPAAPTNVRMEPVAGSGTGNIAGTLNTTYTFFATSPADPDPFDMPPTYNVTLQLRLSGPASINKAMAPVDGTAGPNEAYFATVNYVNEATFATGTWSWLVRANDGHGHDNATDAAGTTFSVVANGNEALAGATTLPTVIPDDTDYVTVGVGSSSSTFVFRVRYSHPSGLKPRAHRLMVDDDWRSTDHETSEGKTGVMIWIHDHTGTFRPHFMVWDTATNGKAEGAATAADYAAGVTYMYTVRPECQPGSVPFAPAYAASPDFGYAWNNFFTGFGSESYADWGAGDQGIAQGALRFYYDTTANYRPAQPGTGNYRNHYTPNLSATPDILAGTEPGDYSVVRAPAAGSESSATVRPMLARGGCANDMLNTTATWTPEDYVGLDIWPDLSNTGLAPNDGTLNYWPLENGGRSRGTTEQSYDFYVKYFADNNSAPAYVAVYLDGTYHQMTKVNAGDNNYVDGAWYRYTTTLTATGAAGHSYYFEGFDGAHKVFFPTRPGDPTRAQVVEQTKRINNRPVLNAPTVSPSTGDEDTTFTYTVRYQDTDTDEARWAYVDIYDSILQPAVDGSSNPLPGTVATVGGNNITVSTTRWTGHGTHLVNWYVKMVSGAIGAHNTTRGQYFRINSVTEAPAGTWTANLGSNEFGQSVAAAGVAVGDQFIVVYRGAMTRTTDVTGSGRLYTFAFNQFFQTDTARELRYAFTFADNWGMALVAAPAPPLFVAPGEPGEWINSPAGDRYGVEASYWPGPALDAANHAPVLSQPAVSALTPDPPVDAMPTSDPNEGTSATLFRFRVTYTDQDGDLPTQIQVGTSNTATPGAPPTYGTFGSWTTLQSEVPGDTDTKDGKVYYTEMRLPAMVAPTAYAHSFRANDGTAAAVFQEDTAGWPGPDYFILDTTAQRGKMGPIVHQNTPPTLGNVSVTPDPALLNQTVTYTVTYFDEDDYSGVHGNPPTYVYLYIDEYLDDAAHRKTMTKVTPADDNYTTAGGGAQYSFSIPAATLGAGQHRYFILCSDGADTGRTPASGFSLGPQVQQPHSISGTILTNLAAPLEGVAVTAGTYSATTAADGTYTLSDMVAGTYTVTPALAEYTFAPVTRSVTLDDVVVDATGADFTATQKTYTIAGTITDGANPLPNVSVSYGAGSVLTNGLGQYTIGPIVAGTYTITPTLSEYTFAPVDQSVTVNEVVGSQAGINFTGTLMTYTIAGTITDGVNPIANVSVSDGTNTVVTNALGQYTFTGELAGTYTITPTLSEWTFAPVSRSVTVNETVGSQGGQNFTGTRKTYTIAGTITITPGGAPLSGVLVTAGTRTATTGALGTYTITGLLAGAYTVTPTRAEYAFTPITLPVTVNEGVGNSTGQDFTATLATYSITGTITDGVNPIPNVSVSNGFTTELTNGTGVYTFAGLIAGTYTVTPTLAEWTFAPLTRSVTVSQALGNATGQDFTGTQATYTVSGTITVTPGGAVLPGVAVNMGALNTTTNGLGQYSFTGVVAGSYTVTPTLAEYTFNPVSRPVTVNGTVGNALNQNFVGAVNTYSIAGTITDGVNPINNVQVIAGSRSASSNAAGQYTITGLAAGTYTVTPTLTEYVFTPTNRSVTVNSGTGNVTGQDFTGARNTYSIAGRVLDSLSNPMQNVDVSADGHTVQTDVNGDYSITGLFAGTYTVQATEPEWQFAPASRSVTVNVTVGSATGVNFTGTRRTYYIAGVVLNWNGLPVQGVQVTAGAQTTATDPQGKYRIGGLLAGTFTVTPALAGYAFTPPTRSATVNQTVGSAENVSFTATLVFTRSFAGVTQMVGLPLIPDTELDPTVIFQTPNVARWDPAGLPPDYVVAGDPGWLAFLTAAPGKGYFIHPTGTVNVQVNGQPVRTDQDFYMNLGPSWNMVANPFLNNLPIGNVFAQSFDLYPYAFVYDPGTGSYLLVSNEPGLNVARTIIYPWEGMWVRAKTLQPLIIMQPPVGPAAAEEKAPAPQQVDLGADGWSIPVVARAAGRADLLSVAGVSSKVKDYAIANPPAMAGSVDVYFVDEQGNQLAQYVKPAQAGAQTWDFVVTTDLPGAVVALSLPDLSQVPNELSVTLTDVDAGRQVYARTLSQYTFNSAEQGATVRHFRLVVAPKAGGGLAFTTVTAQQTGTGVVFAFSVSQGCQVSAQVMNIAGKTIRTLTAERACAAGLNTLNWNLRNEGGALVPGGRYLLRLEAVAENGQRVQTICPAMVSR